ncbi:hypothetical protein GCM10017673_27050 [Streptosporangium violaceochromogenes]|nr:hypothetical protein GCM10017673_27050 [Streptosporangium violaceochromogenes]
MGETMGAGHLDRLRRIRGLVARNDKYDTSRTRLVCYSGSGFTEELLRLGERDEVELVGVGDLYG